mmetsp:Transcript_11933/g.43016  ORF Transcript_11933/g.43016 Transcript_11933/m.43016 type:complete len:297 (-) Transcript_11933:354-1244(-)
MTLFLVKSNVFPLDTSKGTAMFVAFAGDLHRTMFSARYSAGIGPVVPNLHHTGSSTVNPAPNTLTTVPPPLVPAGGDSDSTSASARGSKYVCDPVKSSPAFVDVSTDNERPTAASENVGVSHRKTALDTALAPTVYAPTPPKRHDSASFPFIASDPEPRKIPPPLPGCAVFPWPYPHCWFDAIKFAPATVTSVPPDASPVGGNKTSGSCAAWNSNTTPNVVKFPGPADTSTETNPTACGGERHVAVVAVTSSPSALDASTGKKPNRHVKVGLALRSTAGTKFFPCTITEVPPTLGP